MDTKQKSFIGANWPTLLWVVLSVVLIVSMVVMMAVVKTPTPLENALMTFILTAASSVISYLVSKMFAEQGFHQTMRDHGVQIARGIIELKSQVGTLADWITGKREMLGRTGKLNESSDSALEHVQVTLNGFRGMADNAVGGIAGVIGDAYAQYEDFITQIERIRTEGQLKTSELEEEMELTQSPADFQQLQKKIDEIASQTEKKISQLAKNVSLPLPPAASQRSFSVTCPLCSAPNGFEMLEKHGETKSLFCKRCGKPFNAHFSMTRGIFTGLHSLPHATGLVQQQHLRLPPVQPRPDWVTPAAIADEARMLLRKTQAFVEPSQIENLVERVLAHDIQVKQSGRPCSAYDLQAKMLADGEKSVPSVAVRNFFKMLFLGGTFQMSPEGPTLFRSYYINTLTKDGLLAGYVAGTVRRLANMRPLDQSIAGELARALFDGEGPTREAMVTGAIERNCGTSA